MEPSTPAQVFDVEATLPDRPALDAITPATIAATGVVKREPGTGETGHNPNQNQAQIDIKQEPMATDIMNQQSTSSPTPKLLPSFAFPPLALPSSPSSTAAPPPLSALAPSLFPLTSSPTPTTSSTPSSSSPSTSSSSSSSIPSLPLSPAVPSAMQPRLAPTPSVPLTAPPSSWEQQTLARLNSLTQMTSQIASIALEKTAAKPEAVVEEADKPDSVVEWVTSISRSLQTELQSVYLTLHSGSAEPSSLPVSPVPVLVPATPAPLPLPMTVPATHLSLSPSPSPLSLSPLLAMPAEMTATTTTTSGPTTLPNATDEANEKKCRRRRKTKTKDSFNHMQRKCASCQRTETTKWRHGPLGSNTLCNTCGLAYSRKKKREAEQAAKLSAAAAASNPSP